MSVDTTFLAVLDRSLMKTAIAEVAEWRAERLSKLPVMWEINLYENAKRKLGLVRIWYRDIDVDANSELSERLVWLDGGPTRRVGVVLWYGDDVNEHLQSLMERFDGLDTPFVTEGLEPDGPGWKLVEHHEN